MKLFFHYCASTGNNSYILGTDFSDETGQAAGQFAEQLAGRLEEPLSASGEREAIIVDPGSMDAELLDFIEKNDYTLKGALVTHDHPDHTRGLRTLKKIYDVDIYGLNPVIGDYKSKRIKDGDTLEIASFKIEVISVPGHSSDSVVYKTGHLLFTGDVLSAGLVGGTDSSSGLQVEMNSLRGKIFPLPGDYLVLPGHGPPSSLETERLFNVMVKQYEQRKKASGPAAYWDDF